MKLFQTAKMEQAYLKAGIFGFAGAGKTTTAAMLAMGIHNYIKTKKPVGFIETEDGSDWLVKKFETENIPFVRIKTRAITTLIDSVKEAEKEQFSCLIVDSITHFWADLLTAKLEAINKSRKSKGKYPLSQLPMPAFNDVKRVWSPWADLYRSVNLHMIVCGRAGWEWTEEENEEGQDKLVKEGTKMKAEGEFGYEAAFLIEMIRTRIDDSPGAGWTHRAVILKDKSDTINGKCFDFKKLDDDYKKGAYQYVFNKFLPHFSSLNLGGNHIAIGDREMSSRVFPGVDGESTALYEDKRRLVAIEEIDGILTSMFPGQSAEVKAYRGLAVYFIFNTHSKTKVEQAPLAQLEDAVKIYEAVAGEIEGREEPLSKEQLTTLLSQAQKAVFDSKTEEKPEVAVVSDDLPQYDLSSID